MLFLINDFFVGQCRECFRIPIDHSNSSVYQTFLVQIAKHFDDTFRTFFVHGERCSVPITRSTEFFQLFENDSTVFVSPVPSMFEKFIPCQITLFDPFRCQFGNHFCFGGNGSMVSSGHPAGIFTLHSSTTNQNVLNRIVKHVSHVKNTGNIGRRNDNGIRFAFIGFGMEEFVFQPILIPFVFYFGRTVFCSKFHNTSENQFFNE